MVRNIIGMIAGGYTVDRILQAYPELTQEMVQAALEYAATVIDEEQVIARAWRTSANSSRPGKGVKSPFDSYLFEWRSNSCAY